jgi:hypothetical protein
MRTRWNLALALPVAAGLLAGCGGSDAANEERRAAGPQSTAPEASARATVVLTGCIEPAPGDRYLLRQVQFQGDRAAADPHRTTTAPAALGITEGSWVRLAPGEQDLRTLAGQRVTLTGEITDSGQNTIGTAGTPGVTTPAGNASQAASKEHHSEKVKTEVGRIGRESMANGTAAEIRVQQVQGTGERCQASR